MADMLSKATFGPKERVATAISEGKIDEYDITYLDNREIGWVDRNGQHVIATVRTQDDIQVNGVTDLGVNNGETIPAGKSFDEIVKMLVQKPIPATYQQPTITLTNNDGGKEFGTYEVGTYINPRLRAVYNANDAGFITAMSIKKGDTVVAEGNSVPLDYNADSFYIGDETVSFYATATHAEGNIKNNNLGQPSPEGHIEAGTIISSAYNYVGQRNLFYGTGVGSLPELTSEVVRGLSNKKLNPTEGYSFTIPVAIGQQYIIFAYPATLRDVSTVKYEEANDSSMANNFTKTLVDVADIRGLENGLKSYKVYSYSMLVPAAATMGFTVTI